MIVSSPAPPRTPTPTAATDDTVLHTFVPTSVRPAARLRTSVAWIPFTSRHVTVTVPVLTDGVVSVTVIVTFLGTSGCAAIVKVVFVSATDATILFVVAPIVGTL